MATFSPEGKLFEGGRLILWSPTLKPDVFTTIGGGAWLTVMGTTLLNRHVRGMYGERTQSQKDANADALSRQRGWITSRYPLLGKSFYAVTVFPLSTEPTINRTYLVEGKDYERFVAEVLKDRMDERVELREADKRRAKKRKASRARESELQIEGIEEAPHEY